MRNLGQKKGSRSSLFLQQPENRLLLGQAVDCVLRHRLRIDSRARHCIAGVFEVHALGVGGIDHGVTHHHVALHAQGRAGVRHDAQAIERI